MSGLTISNLAQQVQDLLDKTKQQNTNLAAWLGGSADGGPNNDGLYPFVDLTGREILVPAPAKLADTATGPAAQAVAAMLAAQASEQAADGSANRANEQRVLAEAARGAAVEARNLAQEHRNHAGTSEANARYWAELAQSKGEGSSEDRAVVEQLAEEVADNAAMAAQDAEDAAASAALAATFDPNLFDKKSDTLSATRLVDMIDPARIPVLVGQTPIVSTGGVSNLTAQQQTAVMPGTLVATTDGRRWVYSGTGSKTAEASYIEQGDVTPIWDVIANKPNHFPTNIANVAGLQSALDGKAAAAHMHYVTDVHDLLLHLNSKAAASDPLFPAMGGSEGGQIRLGKPLEFSDLTSDVAIDLNGQYLRIFENAAPFRGFFFNFSSVAGGQVEVFHKGNLDPSSFASKATPQFTGSVSLSGGVGAERAIYLKTDGVDRWRLSSNGVAETGGNAGSNFSLDRYSDAGARIDTAFAVSRSTGQATFAARPVFAGATPWDTSNLTQPAVRNASNTFAGEQVFTNVNQLRLKDSPTATAPSVIYRKDNSNYYLLLTNENDADGQWNGLRPFTVNLPSGQVTISTRLNVSGEGLWVNSDSGFRLASGDGRGLRFWDDDTYKVYMSSAANGTWGGRVAGETTSDYNIYFRNGGGTNRGWVYKNGNAIVAGVDGGGTFRTVGQIHEQQKRVYSDNYPARKIPTADPNVGTGGVWVDSTSGMRIARNNTFYGLWDTGNLTHPARTDGTSVLFGDYSGGVAVQTNGSGWRNLASIGYPNTFSERQHFYSQTVTADVWNGGVEIQEVQNVANTAGKEGHEYAPALTFHWKARIARAVYMDGDGWICFGQQGNKSNLSGIKTSTVATNGGELHLQYGTTTKIKTHANGTETYGNSDINGSIYLRSSSPTVVFQDSDNRSGMIHVNSSRMYFLRGSGTNATGWESTRGGWPLELNLENNDAYFGGEVYGATNGWFRVRQANGGPGGIYWEAYGGGWHMSDSSWIRAYGDKGIYTPGQIRGGTVVGESDKRLKTNIAPITDATAKVEALSGVTFDWLKTGSAGMGFIAQDFETVLPTLVTEDTDGMKGVEYGPVVALLVEALKETNARVAALESGRV